STDESNRSRSVGQHVMLQRSTVSFSCRERNRSVSSLRYGLRKRLPTISVLLIYRKQRGATSKSDGDRFGSIGGGQVARNDRGEVVRYLWPYPLEHDP